MKVFTLQSVLLLHPAVSFRGVRLPCCAPVLSGWSKTVSARAVRRRALARDPDHKMLGARSDEGSSKLATLVASAASQHTASSVSTLESGQAESSNSAATQLGPSKQRSRMRRLILGVVALGLASHVLIHSYASQLADTGQLLRFVKPVASNNAARVGVVLTQPKVAGSSAAARAALAADS